jgi:hypothetical protein
MPVRPKENTDDSDESQKQADAEKCSVDRRFSSEAFN